MTEPEAGWDPPDPIDEIDRTPLPARPDGQSTGSVNFVNAPTGALWDFVDAVAEGLQVPRDMVFLLVLSILSTASGGHWRVRVAHDWVEPLALMTVTSMVSGSRKSATVKAVAAPLYEVERDLVTAASPQIAERQALRDARASDVERLKRKAGKDDAAKADLVSAIQAVEDIDVPAIPRLLADDITPERLGSLMAEQGGRMGVISAEGGLFAILAGRYSSGQPNLDLVLKAHAGDPVRVDRIGRPPLMLDEPFLAIGVTVQPDILEGLAATRLFRGSGLLARFLYSLPVSMIGRRKLDPEPIPDSVSAAYGARVRRMARAAHETSDVVELGLSDAAQKVLWEFRAELEPELDPYGGKYGEIVDWASKLPGHLTRIAALFCLFGDPTATEVDEPAMRAAVGLADYLTDQALAAFDVINGRKAKSTRPRAVVAWIRRKELTEFTVRQARRELGGQEWAHDVENIRDVLEDLEDLRWVRRREDTQTGRPGRPSSERYDVNPAAHKKGTAT